MQHSLGSERLGPRFPAGSNPRKPPTINATENTQRNNYEMNSDKVLNNLKTAQNVYDKMRELGYMRDMSESLRTYLGGIEAAIKISIEELEK